MAWTTSADPRAKFTRTDVSDWRGQLSQDPLVFIRQNKAVMAQGAAVVHLVVLSCIAAVLPHSPLALLLVASGAALALLAVFGAGLGAIPGRPAPPSPRTSAVGPSRTPGPSPVDDPAQSILMPAEAPELEPDPRPATAAEGSVAAATPSRPAVGSYPASAAGRPNAHNADWADLMARVSHELRTPLNAVLGFSDLMDRGLFGPLGHHRYQEYVRHIHDSGRDLLKSAEDTLAVTSLLTATGPRAAPEALDIAAVVADAWSFFGRHPAARGIELAAKIEVDAEVLGERRALRQALVNLLSEAVARAPAGTAIRVSAWGCASRLTLVIATSPGEGTARREPSSLDVCLARKLLEFHGADLVECIHPEAGWSATTILDRANQTDFFSERRFADGAILPLALARSAPAMGLGAQA